MDLYNILIKMENTPVSREMSFSIMMNQCARLRVIRPRRILARANIGQLIWIRRMATK